jgi:hypothetical protein
LEISPFFSCPGYLPNGIQALMKLHTQDWLNARGRSTPPFRSGV